jgi:DNA adenine methylase
MLASPVQTALAFEEGHDVKPFNLQLLKWVGNKQRFAFEIASYFPSKFNVYLEPFIGSGAVLGTLAPKQAIAGDIFRPLIDIWKTLQDSPETLIEWYAERWQRIKNGNKREVYEKVRADYNEWPNGQDLLFLSRSCYGGVVRFRQSDGFMSTPCGAHDPISPKSFGRRVSEWHLRTANTKFFHRDFKATMEAAAEGDLVYCDPPYTHSQSILYGAHTFSLADLMESIEKCKKRGVFVALSIDGTKKSGEFICDIPIPEGIFEREVFVNCGRSMLKRFQMDGRTLESESVSDRLLLTY